MDDGPFTFHFETALPCSVETAFQWHKRPGAFKRLLPPFSPIQLLSKDHQLKKGERLDFKFRLFNDLGIHSTHEITYYEENDCFVDEQIKGMFKAWNHLHQFREKDENSCVLEDIIRYKLPVESFLGHLFNTKVAKKLTQVFRYRRAILKNDLAFLKKHPHKKMHILMTGTTGLVGSSLKALLETLGHVITPVRRQISADQPGVFWDIENQKIDISEDDHFDAIIHLAGENIAQLWTPAAKEAIYKSRINSTRLLVSAVQRMKKPPKTFICASGINYYPQGRTVDESSPEGDGFLKQVIEDWEGATRALKNVRTAFIRTGVVLSPEGGMLKKLLKLYKVGLGAQIGEGRHKMSWIALDDLIYIYAHVLFSPHLEGPINATSPDVVSQKEFSKTLASVLNRPHFLKMPTKAIDVLLSEMGKETVLSDLHVVPKKLLEDHYTFVYPKLQVALEHLLGLE